MPGTNLFQRLLLLVITLAALILTLLANSRIEVQGQTISGRDMTVLVTAMPKNDRERVPAAKLQPEDFTVSRHRPAGRVGTEWRSITGRARSIGWQMKPVAKPFFPVQTL